jgi:hypothetical protein
VTERLLKALMWILSIALVSTSQLAEAFDGTDASPPRIISMRLLTPAPTSVESLIVIEVMTEDDKNWTQITGNPQLGYSYVISNRNIAPNCSIVTRSFSKLEVLEDLNFKSASLGNPKKQRFLLAGMAPRPLPLPSNCPEYRNLSLLPAVALNSTTFPTSTNKVTGVSTILNNVLTPSLQDEAGRTTPPSSQTGLLALSLIQVNPQIGETEKFCITPALLPERNPTIAANRERYLNELNRARELNIDVTRDEVVLRYEAQIQGWTDFLSNFATKQLSLLPKCITPLSASQVTSAYQVSTRAISVLIAQRTAENLEKECIANTSRTDRARRLFDLLMGEKVETIDFREFSRLVKTVKPLDCKKVSSTSILEQRKHLEEIETILATSEQSFLDVFCERRNYLRTEYLSLYDHLKFRYGLTDLFRLSNLEMVHSQFFTCESRVDLDVLTSYVVLTDSLITNMNSYFSRLQKLERQRSVVIRVECRLGKRVLVRKGTPPKCPKGSRESPFSAKKIDGVRDLLTSVDTSATWSTSG